MAHRLTSIILKFSAPPVMKVDTGAGVGGRGRVIARAEGIIDASHAPGATAHNFRIRVGAQVLRSRLRTSSLASHV